MEQRQATEIEIELVADPSPRCREMRCYTEAMRQGTVLHNVAAVSRPRTPVRPTSHFGREMRRLSERAVASAKKRLSLAEINRELARRRAGRT